MISPSTNQFDIIITYLFFRIFIIDISGILSKVLEKTEIGISEIALVFYEVELEISVSLLVFRHGGVAEMIEVYIFDTSFDTVGKPTVDESGSCLVRFGFLSGKGNEVYTGIVRIIMNRQSCDGGIPTVTYITSDRFSSYFFHGTVISDIIRFEKMLYPYLLESMNEYIAAHEFYAYFGLGK